MNIAQDIFKGEILPKLGIRDIINLKVTNKSYYDNIDINDIISNKITKRLKTIFEDKWEGFSKELERSGAVISGSFIIQCILDEQWDDVSKQDIDIYVSLPDDQSELKPSGNNTTKLETWFFENKFIWNNYQACNRYADDISRDISWIRDLKFCEIEHQNLYLDLTVDESESYLCKIGDIVKHNKSLINPNKPTIQIIEVNKTKEELWDFIQSNFDFDICKNVYGIKDGKPYVKILAINQILAKRTQYKVGTRPGASKVRKEKYESRGFIFDKADFKNICTRHAILNRRPMSCSTNYSYMEVHNRFIH